MAAAAAQPPPREDERPRSWQNIYEAEQVELQRSERVQQQLREVLATLQKRGYEMAAENDRIRAEAQSDHSFEALREELKSQGEACEAVQQEHGAVLQEVAEHRHAADAQEALAEERSAAAVEAEASAEALEQRRNEADERREQAASRARSMVAAGTLERVSDEARKLQRRLEEQEAEGARLRQALMDSWAARADPEEPASTLQDLAGVEEELNWLTRMQQESTAELHRTQHLERSEAALQARVRELSEEKAALQSARVDLGTAGGTLRETIASQSEGWVRKVDDLEQQRRMTDGDRVKLINECADLQARLDAIAPQLEGVQELEEKHAKLKAERGRLADESQRLRDVNGALGVLLLGDDAPPPVAGEGGDAGAVAEALTRVVQLQSRLNDRMEAQALEKQSLADRIRDLERQALQPNGGLQAADEKAGGSNSFAPQARGLSSAAHTASGAVPLSGSISSASAAVGGALRGGFGRLRDAAASAVL